jgi:hypothetical protein
MKTIKIMCIIAVAWLGAHLLVVNYRDYITIHGPESNADFLQTCYVIALGIVGIVQTNRAMKISKITKNETSKDVPKKKSFFPEGLITIEETQQSVRGNDKTI